MRLNKKIIILSLIIFIISLLISFITLFNKENIITSHIYNISIILTSISITSFIISLINYIDIKNNYLNKVLLLIDKYILEFSKLKYINTKDINKVIDSYLRFNIEVNDIELIINDISFIIKNNTRDKFIYTNLIKYLNEVLKSLELIKNKVILYNSKKLSKEELMSYIEKKEKLLFKEVKLKSKKHIELESKGIEIKKQKESIKYNLVVDKLLDSYIFINKLRTKLV